MGRDVYFLRFMLSRRSNGEKQIFNFSGLSLLCWWNSEELTRFRTAADTVFQKQTLFMQWYAAKKCVKYLVFTVWSTRQHKPKKINILPHCGHRAIQVITIEFLISRGLSFRGLSFRDTRFSRLSLIDLLSLATAIPKNNVNKKTALINDESWW